MLWQQWCGSSGIGGGGGGSGGGGSGGGGGGSGGGGGGGGEVKSCEKLDGAWGRSTEGKQQLSAQ